MEVIREAERLYSFVWLTLKDVWQALDSDRATQSLQAASATGGTSKI